MAPRVVVFLDVHLPQKIIRNVLAGDESDIVVEKISSTAKRKISHFSDGEILQYFEDLARRKYPQSRAFLMTWDSKFDIESGHDPIKNTVSILKTPQFEKRSRASKRMLKAIKKFLLASVPQDWDMQFHGFIDVRSIKKRAR